MTRTVTDPGSTGAEPARSARIVLLDDDGRAIGTAPKATSHHRRTPLHLAFSCYVFNDRGELLVTRRSMTKLTWPGELTNSCCGHPAPGESMLAAVLRCVVTELGAPAATVEAVLPAFRYHAVMANGTVENEMCPVFRVRVAASVDPNPDEVHEYWWAPWSTFADDVVNGALDVSPWCHAQVQQLKALGDDPMQWPAGRVQDLPVAAREILGSRPHQI